MRWDVSFCSSCIAISKTGWGVEVFKGFFERIVYQCLEAGLVDGKKIFIDFSSIAANALNSSVADI